MCWRRPSTSGRPPGLDTLVLRNGRPQVSEELTEVCSVLAAGIVKGVEAANRAADAPHLVSEKDPDRLRPLPHDVIDELGGLYGHDRLPISVRCMTSV